MNVLISNEETESLNCVIQKVNQFNKCTRGLENDAAIPLRLAR